MDALLLRVDLKVCRQLRVRPPQSVQIGNPSSTVLVYFLWLLLVLPPSLFAARSSIIISSYISFVIFISLHRSSAPLCAVVLCLPLLAFSLVDPREFFFFSDLEISMRVRDRLSQWWWLRCSLTSLASVFRLHSKFFPFQFFSEYSSAASSRSYIHILSDQLTLLLVVNYFSSPVHLRPSVPLLSVVIRLPFPFLLVHRRQKLFRFADLEVSSRWEIGCQHDGKQIGTPS